MQQTRELLKQPPPPPLPHGAKSADGAGPGGQRIIRIGQTVADVERHFILDTLDHCLGNRTHAARLLGISIRTLRNKLNDYAEAGHAVAEPGQTRPDPR